MFRGDTFRKECGERREARNEWTGGGKAGSCEGWTAVLAVDGEDMSMRVRAFVLFQILGYHILM